jgi:hypothetical protein
MFGESVVGKVARRKSLFTNRFDLPDGDESIHPAPTVSPNDAAQYSLGHVDVNRNSSGGDDIVSAIFCDYLTVSQPQAYMHTARYAGRERCIRL